MAFFFGLTALSWLCFIFFANKKKLRLFLPTCLLAMYLACTVDFFAHHYDLWNYPAPTGRQTYWYHLSQQFGIYPIVVYFYLQWLPKGSNRLIFVGYVFLWTLFSILIEWLAVKLGYMEHKKWWTLWVSYVADWILFVVFYRNYRWWMKPREDIK